MRVQDARHDAIAHNLANGGTTGYCRRSVAIAALPVDLGGLPGPKVRSAAAPPLPTILQPLLTIDRTPGAPRPTGNATDFALSADAYFTIDVSTDPTLAPQGTEAYTRRGSFILDTENRLVTSEGRPVLGQSGPVTITSPNWSVDPRGVVTMDGQAVNQLKLVRPTGTQDDATQVGDSLWRFAAVVPNDGARVTQGVVENSNVNTVQEMVTMITALRQFEMNQKAFQTQDETLDRAVNDIARV
jgi:flagellar basal-body rod protein FlgG